MISRQVKLTGQPGIHEQFTQHLSRATRASPLDAWMFRLELAVKTKENDRRAVRELLKRETEARAREDAEQRREGSGSGARGTKRKREAREATVKKLAPASMEMMQAEDDYRKLERPPTPPIKSPSPEPVAAAVTREKFQFDKRNKARLPAPTGMSSKLFSAVMRIVLGLEPSQPVTHVDFQPRGKPLVWAQVRCLLFPLTLVTTRAL